MNKDKLIGVFWQQLFNKIFLLTNSANQFLE